MKTVLATAAARAFAMAGPAAAQEFPTAPLTMVVPFPARGPTERVGRRPDVRPDHVARPDAGGPDDPDPEHPGDGIRPDECGANTHARRGADGREEGFPELAIEIWHGLWAPAGTPPATVGRLTAALQAALANPEVAATLTGLGAELPSITEQTPEALHALVAAEIEHWRGLLEGMAP